MAYLSLIRYW